MRGERETASSARRDRPAASVNHRSGLILHFHEEVRVGRRGDFAEAQSARVAQGTPPELQKTPRKANLRTTILRVLATLAVIAITLYTYTLRDRIEEFQALGYPGIFLVALIANATILLPAPGAALVAAVGAIFNPLGVGLAAGTGGIPSQAHHGGHQPGAGQDGTCHG